MGVFDSCAYTIQVTPMGKIEGNKDIESFKRKERINGPGFSSVVVIGAAGQTGQLFTESVTDNPGLTVTAFVKKGQDEKLRANFKESVEFSTDLEETLTRKPEAIILAIPNPTSEVLTTIATHVKGPMTLILPQNGVDVVPTAQRIFSDNGVTTIEIVRASLLTSVSSQDGKAFYDVRKKRIGLAAVDTDNHLPLQKARALFASAGFDTDEFEDYVSMEWTKLIVNRLGSTGAITGLAAGETFADRELTALEVQALKDGILIMRKAGISFAHMRWHKIKFLPLIVHLPESILGALMRKQVAGAKNDQPPAAARKIAEGKSTEIVYYHQPVIDLGQKYGLRSFVDEAIVEIYKKKGDQLRLLTTEERKSLFLETYREHARGWV